MNKKYIHVGKEDHLVCCYVGLTFNRAHLLYTVKDFKMIFS